jgi:starch synthase (maltosyl-transferring)
MMDLVVNHTAKDHPFTKQYPEWYKKNDKGEIKSPGAWDNGQWVEWGDLAEIDNGGSQMKAELWNYWKDLVLFYLGRGIDGFRADAAYGVPAELWAMLIKTAKLENNKVRFFAESLGCTLEQTLSLGSAGFDYIFNSSKWWNYSDTWLLEQYEQTRLVVPSISFPESHDTVRLSIELDNRLEGVKQKTAFSAFFSSGWMVPVGFEYGFKKKLDVVKTIPQDWETVNYDLTDFIRKVNRTKANYAVLNEECDIKMIEHSESENVLVLLKISSNKKQKAIILLNKDWENSRKVLIKNAWQVFGLNVQTAMRDISIENNSVKFDLNHFECELKPCDFKLIICE